MPESVQASSDGTLGRGMAIVSAVSARWGCAPEGSGKVVWCDFPTEPPPGSEVDSRTAGSTADDASQSAAGEPSDGVAQVAVQEALEEALEEQTAPCWTVRIPDVAVGALRGFVVHLDEQLRELQLSSCSDRARFASLVEQIREWTGRPGDRALLRAQALAAADQGLKRVDVVMELSLAAVDGAARHVAAADEIDSRWRAGGLHVLKSSAADRGFRRWLLGELAAGVQRAAGVAAPAPRRFETALVEEVDRLSLRLRQREALDDVPSPRRDWMPPADTGSTFERLMDAAPDAMVAVDSSGVIRLVNRQTEVLFGYARHELVGRAVEILIPESFRGVHPSHRVGYAADPQTRPMGAGLELSGRRRDGSRFPADISLSWIDTEAGPLATAAVRDTTSWRAAREALRVSRQIAEVLQRSLLDIVPGQVGDLAVAVRYHPAQSSATVGGDWHHVFPLETGSVGISVGDVGGKGIEAAATMGRLRTTLSAIAADEPSPGVVLSKVNRMLCRLAGQARDDPDAPHDSDLMATAVYGRIDLAAREFVYAVAGHPGPIVIDGTSGRARLPEPEPNLPLGLEPDTVFHEERLQLPAHGVLLAYTDGLFERRDTPLQESLDALVDQATGLAGSSVDEIADALLGTAIHTQPGRADDIALVVTGW
jgi:PAS domain S-box-containing protein